MFNFANKRNKRKNLYLNAYFMASFQLPVICSTIIIKMDTKQQIYGQIKEKLWRRQTIVSKKFTCVHQTYAINNHEDITKVKYDEKL